MIAAGLPLSTGCLHSSLSVPGACRTVLEAHANLITSQAGATLSPNQVKALLQASPPSPQPDIDW